MRDGLRRGRSPSLLRAATLTAGAGRCGSVAGALREGCSRGQLRCNGRYAGCNVATRTVVNCLAAHLSLASADIGLQISKAAEPLACGGSAVIADLRELAMVVPTEWLL